MCNISKKFIIQVFYLTVINLETEKGKSGATSSTSVPEKDTTLQPVVDDADSKLSYK